MAVDGRVALVGHEPYRVDYVDPAGRRRDGSPIPFSRVRVTEAVKQQWREDRQRPAPVLCSFRNGGSRLTMEKPRYEEPSLWPEYLPPFLRDAAKFAEDGRLWVQRAMGPRDPPNYDVFDEMGRLVTRVQLKSRSRVVGFGNGVVYVIRRDDNDLEYLERYRRSIR